MLPRGTAQGAPMRAPPPPPVILTAVSAFQRRASAHFLRRPRTGKIATSVITRLYAEKAAQRNGSVRLCEAQLREPGAHSLNSDLHAARFFNCNACSPCGCARRDFRGARDV